MLKDYEPYSSGELLSFAREFWDRRQNVTVEQYMDIISACDAYGLELTDEEIISLQSVIYDIWLHIETHESLQQYVDNIIAWMEANDISVEEVRGMQRYELLKKVFDFCE